MNINIIFITITDFDSYYFIIMYVCKVCFIRVLSNNQIVPRYDLYSTLGNYGSLNPSDDGYMFHSIGQYCLNVCTIRYIFNSVQNTVVLYVYYTYYHSFDELHSLDL